MRAVALLLLIAAAGVIFPLLNAYTQPRGQALQQGRYLFPALAPIALLLVLGWWTVRQGEVSGHSWAFI